MRNHLVVNSKLVVVVVPPFPLAWPKGVERSVWLSQQSHIERTVLCLHLPCHFCAYLGDYHLRCEAEAGYGKGEKREQSLQLIWQYGIVRGYSASHKLSPRNASTLPDSSAGLAISCQLCSPSPLFHSFPSIVLETNVFSLIRIQEDGKYFFPADIMVVLCLMILAQIPHTDKWWVGENVFFSFKKKARLLKPPAPAPTASVKLLPAIQPKFSLFFLHQRSYHCNNLIQHWMPPPPPLSLLMLLTLPLMLQASMCCSLPKLSSRVIRTVLI